MDHVPGTPANPQPQPQVMQIPMIELGGCAVDYVKGPDGIVRMLVGPVMLALPFTEQNAKVQADKLRTAAAGIVIAGAGAPS